MARTNIFVLLLIIFSFKFSSSVSVDKCNTDRFFVENYIKYECFQNTDAVGVKIVGCQPSNNLTGVTLEAWQTYDERWFKYHCVIEGNNAQYSVKTCLDPLGEVLPVGKTRSFPDGETFTCFFEKNKVKLNHQTTVGCQVGNQTYGDRATWILKKENVINVGSENKIVGQGTAMQCSKHSNGTFFVEAAACLTSQNTYIRPDSYGTVDGEVVKCDLKNGECQLRIAHFNELGCQWGNKVFRHNQEWVSEDNTSAYVCQFGKIEKKGCYVGAILIPLYATKYVDGTPFYCYQEKNARSFGSLKGCPVNGGEIVPFETRIKNGKKMESCGFSFNANGTINFKWSQVGCVHSKEFITINAIQQIGDQYVHCVLNGTNGYIVKIMTRVEVENWLTATKQKWSNIVSGNEGEGKSVKREIPTIEHTTVSTSTTVPPSTTVSPSTTVLPPTKAPSTTTSTTTSTTVIPSTSPATTTTTTKPPPAKKCVDLADDCHLMQSYCKSDSENIKILKETIEKSPINSKEKSVLMEFVDTQLLKNDDVKDVKTDCFCDKRKPRIHGDCECEYQKKFNWKLVRSLCPKTCNACKENRAPISTIIKSEMARVCQKNTCY